ncbi:MAG: hypothetical protein HQL94_06010, partial [Magnetococcales bacterium]|nr:hypothetical protein [Magnetococcales bacterium]
DALAVGKDIPFPQRLEGRFDGVIRLADVATLGGEMARRDGWYVVEPQHLLPESPVDGATAKENLDAMVAEILQVERGVWTTMVYVQSFEDPWIVKVFHPRRAGCGCGVGGGIVPWRVFTRFKPSAVPAWETTACAVATPDSGPKAWLKKFL